MSAIGEEMTIGEFSKQTGMPVHTIRFYEKRQILGRVSRDKGGRRSFTEKDLAWAAFITRLKETNMPLSEIKRYTDLRSSGKRTIPERRALLEQHAKVLKQRILKEQAALVALQQKIAFYKDEIRRVKSA
jgi:DNA-binding transcriptional MerR regulator